MKLREKLSKIQTELKANKSQFNKFGKYHYRSLEDVYEGLKPLLNKYACSLTIDNDLEVVNDILFRKSIATLWDSDTEDKVCAHTFTRERLDAKGMSPEQCSGSTASYSDKYCLNKLFCIDDNKDADYSNQGNESRQAAPAQTKVSPLDQLINLVGKYTGGFKDEEKKAVVCKHLGIATLSDLRNRDSDTLNEMINFMNELK